MAVPGPQSGGAGQLSDNGTFEELFNRRSYYSDAGDSANDTEDLRQVR